MIAMIDDVTVSATVGTSLTFTVAGVADSQTAANGESTNTTITSTPTAIPWGTLAAGTAKVARQDLTVATNATNGYKVTLQFDQPLTSTASDTIDFFKDGNNQASSTAWATPSNTLDTPTTYGHMGFTSDDADIGTNQGSTVDFGVALYAGNATSSHIVMDHTGPADGTTANKGAAKIGFKIQIAALQESGDSYTAALTYIVTPTF